MSSFKLYHYILCPYCKPIHYFVNETKLLHEEIHLDLLKREHLTPEYLKINPFGKVPALIEEDGFIIYESSTVLRYICNTRDVPDHWYPKDPKKRSQVDLFFDWYQVNTKSFAKYYYSKAGIPNKLVPPGYDAGPELLASLKEVENTFLKDRKYLAGDEISLADIQLIFFFVNLELLDYDLSGFPKTRDWKDRILATTIKVEYQNYLDGLLKRREELLKKKSQRQK